MARYGLPDDVQFCKRCVQSNQKVVPSQVQKDSAEGEKPTMIFKDGICQPCHIYEAKANSIDWDLREKELVELLDRYRSKTGAWDCLIPGSGGKDSVYQAHILKNKYGMNPLTVTWTPHIYTDIGRKNFDAWVHNGGFDNFLFTPNGEKHAKLTRLAFENLLHPFQPFVFGQRNYVMHMARKFGIKLIFFGENPAEYGGREGEEDSSKMDPYYYVDDARDEMKIAGLSFKELEDQHGITQEDMKLYLPLTTKEAEETQADPRWLGYFLHFHPQSNYYYAREHVGFEASDQRTDGTYSRYNSIDDKIDGFHYWCGLIKFGVGRTTHEASQEIRHGDLTREEGVALVQKYDGEFPKRYFQDFLDYMKMDEDTFFSIVEKFRSEHLWEMKGNDWVLKNPIT